jgi:hypothetical protein
MTFVWDSSENGNNLVVTCSYGGNTATDNAGTCTLPCVTNGSAAFAPEDNPAITVTGTCYSYWSGNSYVVTFSGQMKLPALINAYSSDQNGVTADAEPIIVIAYLDS